jgi:succinate dehydrogenase/fumarate reductase cytochrome b subunit (b558 family)
MQTMLMKFYSASIGKKVVMAMTGTILFLFVIVHMLGNLQVFSGPEKLNAYAHFLKSTTLILLYQNRSFLKIEYKKIIFASHPSL